MPWKLFHKRAQVVASSAHRCVQQAGMLSGLIGVLIILQMTDRQLLCAAGITRP